MIIAVHTDKLLETTNDQIHINIVKLTGILIKFTIIYKKITF